MNSIAGVIFLLVGIALFFLPTIIAIIRHHRNWTAILATDVVVGWTLMDCCDYVHAATTWSRWAACRRDTKSLGAGADPLTRTPGFANQQIRWTAARQAAFLARFEHADSSSD